MSNPPKRRALGRGLSALLPGAETQPPPDAGARTARAYVLAPIEDIYPSPDQPRRRFDDAALAELAESIRAHGIIQPVIVRARGEGGYHLIAGERRWRAAQRAGLHEIPAVIQNVAPGEAFERALVENLQRADLNSIEEALAYSRLVEDFGYTQDQVAERVGKDRSTVANSLRLLKLPGSVRAMVEDDELSMGHARALLRLDEPSAIETAAREVKARKLSVRATEALAARRAGAAGKDGADDAGSGAAAQANTTAKTTGKTPAVRDLENRLTQSLGAKVAVDEDTTGKGGAITIRYLNLDDLDRLLEILLP